MSNLKAGKPDAVFALVDNLARVKYADLPAEAVNTTKLDILDCLGVAVAASTTDVASRKIVDLVTEIGGREESTIIGYGRRVPAHAAAFANAALTHALNYDDYTDPLITHFGCVIFPAAFAMAERVGKVSGKEFITTYTLGVDPFSFHGLGNLPWYSSCLAKTRRNKFGRRKDGGCSRTRQRRRCSCRATLLAWS